jgi:hypothetical protein
VLYETRAEKGRLRHRHVSVDFKVNTTSIVMADFFTIPPVAITK